MPALKCCADGSAGIDVGRRDPVTKVWSVFSVKQNWKHSQRSAIFCKGMVEIEPLPALTGFDPEDVRSNARVRGSRSTFTTE